MEVGRWDVGWGEVRGVGGCWAGGGGLICVGLNLFLIEVWQVAHPNSRLSDRPLLGSRPPPLRHPR